ncbi:MAG: tRNA pseudouridine(55) synthase TruB [Candidatus Babeliales bacterium]
MEGFLFINKPADITSHDCINHIKKIFGKKIKIGHAGTLDPFATGLLIIGIGRAATRILKHLTKRPKEYISTGKLNILTDTLDRIGTTVEEKNITINQMQLMKAIKQFSESYEQIPPKFSALKFQGKPLYKLARQGLANLEKILAIKKRTVHIYRIELLNFEFPFFTIKTEVSSGTYIRSLLYDIAQKMGTIATTWELCRTKIGDINLDQAINLNEIQSFEDIENNLHSIEGIFLT